MSNIAEKAWDKVRDEKAGDAEWKFASPDHRAKLTAVVGEIQATGRSSGIAGLEKFEEEVGRLLKVDVKQAEQPGAAAADPFAPTVSAPSAESTASEGKGGKAEPQPKGSGAQEADPDPEASAKAAGQRVEADETHSPSRGTAARILGAEALGGGFNPGEEKADAASKRTKAGGKKSGAKASKSPAKSSGGSKK